MFHTKSLSAGISAVKDRLIIGDTDIGKLFLPDYQWIEKVFYSSLKPELESCRNGVIPDIFSKSRDICFFVYRMLII